MTGRGRLLAGAVLAALIGSVAWAQETSPLIELPPLTEGETDLLGGATLAPETGADGTAAPFDPAALLEFAARTPVARAAEEPALRMMPLVGPEAGSILRMTGEEDSRTLRRFLPEGADPATGLQIALRNSIHVLPERSSLRISVNGVAQEPITPAAFDVFATFTVPGTDLVPGENLIRLETALHHRIYCGPEASFALWIEVDLAASGLPLSPGVLDPGAGDLYGLLLAQAARPGGVPVRAAPGAGAEAVRQIAVEVARRLGRTDGAVSIGGVWDPAAALPDLARVVVLTGVSPGADLVVGGDGAAVLRIVLEEGGMDNAAAAVAALIPDRPTAEPASPSAATQVAQVAPGALVPLTRLGLPDTSSRGHYIRHDVSFGLPPDWLVLGPQAARLTLLYGFGEGLAPGSLLLVKVNGTTIRLLPLDRNGGAVQPALDVGFKASLMRPGVNRLTFEAIIPGDPPDLPCPPRDTAMLTLLGASTLAVPESPRMRFPGMENVLPGLDGGGVVGGADAASAGLDAAALMPLTLALRPDPGLAAMPTVLRVLTSPEAGLIRIDDLAVPRGALEEMVRPRPTEAETAAAATDPTLRPPEDTPLIDMSWLYDGLWAIRDGVLGFARPGSPPLSEWLRGKTGRLVLIQPDGALPDDLVLLLGPQTSVSDAANALKAARTGPGGPVGRISVLTPEGDWQSWRPATVAPTLLEPLTFGNLRFIIGTYASWSPILFASVLMGLTFLSAAVAMLFVMTTRGRRKG